MLVQGSLVFYVHYLRSVLHSINTNCNPLGAHLLLQYFFVPVQDYWIFMTVNGVKANHPTVANDVYELLYRVEAQFRFISQLLYFNLLEMFVLLKMYLCNHNDSNSNVHDHQ